jgi:DNA-binding NtrC family response regulator
MTDGSSTVGHRILVVDDAFAIRFAMSHYFTRMGFEVDAAEDLPQAQMLLAQTSYRLVITDLSLTGKYDTEGLDVVGLVHERSPDTAIILLTAYGSREIDTEARRRGAATVLCKSECLEAVAGEAFRLIGLVS